MTPKSPVCTHCPGRVGRSIPTGCSCQARCIVNAAGVYADTLHNLAGRCPPDENSARRGDYFLLDHTAGQHVRHTVVPAAGQVRQGRAGHAHGPRQPAGRPHGHRCGRQEATATTAAGLDEVRTKSGLAVKDIPLRQTITSFAGLRAHEARHDFSSVRLPRLCGLRGHRVPGPVQRPGHRRDGGGHRAGRLAAKGKPSL